MTPDPGGGGSRRDVAGKAKFAIVVHGGVNVAYNNREKVEAALLKAINSGYEILAAGASAIDAVVAAVSVLEDSPYFDAGRGSIETTTGTIEMDAAVMYGPTRQVGAVADVTTLKNPVKGALAILHGRKQVLVVGKGAEMRARELDPTLEIRDPSYFKVKANSVLGVYGSGTGHHGTVGAVALDRHGNLAAATSTGGYPGQIPGRVGDSPIPGAGVYADRNAAFSTSGIGEIFVRYGVSHTIASRVRYLGEPLAVAAQRTFDEVYANEGLKNVDVDGCLQGGKWPECPDFREIVAKLQAPGIGGVIGLDRDGNVLEYFRFTAFARGHRRASDASPRVSL